MNIIDLPTRFEEIIEDAVRIVPRFSHINPSSILVLVKKMGLRTHGKNLGLRHARQGKIYTPIFPDVKYQGRDIRYVIYLNPALCVQDSPMKNEVLDTVMHELWHIGSKGDGKLRRMRHGKEFDRNVASHLRAYRKGGGREAEVFTLEDKIRTRIFARRSTPSILHMPRDLRGALNISTETESSGETCYQKQFNWKSHWVDSDVKESLKRGKDLLPTFYTYNCPNGHELSAARKFKKPRSCSECSKRFDARYLLSEAGENTC